MDLRQIKYFLAVAEELNVGRAAARLHISQPPLTRQIKALEAQLGVTLFIRTVKGVELTQAGEMFKEEAENIRMLVEAAIDRVQRAGAGVLGRLDVAVFGSAIYDRIPELLGEFKRRLPGVSVVLHTMAKDEQIEALRQRRITVAFNRIIDPEPDIGIVMVAEEPLYAVVPIDHPAARKPAMPIEDLAGMPLVLFPNVGKSNFITHVTELCRSHGFEPEVAQVVGDTVTGIALVAHHFGVALVPESAAQALQVKGAAFVPLSGAPDAKVDLCCLYRKGDPSPLLKSLLAVIDDFRAGRMAERAAP